MERFRPRRYCHGACEACLSSCPVFPVRRCHQPRKRFRFIEEAGRARGTLLFRRPAAVARPAEMAGLGAGKTAAVGMAAHLDVGGARGISRCDGGDRLHVPDRGRAPTAHRFARRHRGNDAIAALVGGAAGAGDRRTLRRTRPEAGTTFGARQKLHRLHGSHRDRLRSNSRSREHRQKHRRPLFNRLRRFDRTRGTARATLRVDGVLARTGAHRQCAEAAFACRVRCRRRNRFRLQRPDRRLVLRRGNHPRHDCDGEPRTVGDLVGHGGADVARIDERRAPLSRSGVQAEFSVGDGIVCRAGADGRNARAVVSSFAEEGGETLSRFEIAADFSARVGRIDRRRAGDRSAGGRGKWLYGRRRNSQRRLRLDHAPPCVRVQVDRHDRVVRLGRPGRRVHAFTVHWVRARDSCSRRPC